MASRIFRIFKTVPFHDGGQEEFSNVYRYSVDTAGTGFPEDRALALIDALLAVEQDAHAARIEFTRAESAEVTITDGVLATDVTVEFAAGTIGNLPNTGADDVGAPENVIMVQERVGTKRWLRKFLHSTGVPLANDTSGLSFNWQTGLAPWAAMDAYAAAISPLEYTEPDGSIGNAILEAGNGTASLGQFVADQRVRWHDLKY